MTQTARAKAWATRRAKYGVRGHNSSYSRSRTPAPVIRIENIGGFCPVQAEGTIDGVEFYFRARHAHWRMNIGGADVVLSPAWTYREAYGEGPHDAGYMKTVEAVSFIGQAGRKWLSERPPAKSDASSPSGEAVSAGNPATDELSRQRDLEGREP